MKLSDFLTGVGKPVAFYPGLAKALGGIKQAVFICQMAYWKDKGEDPDGWIYKTSEEIEAETALTYKEQTAVRSALVEKKALQERYARSEHKMYFRVDWDVINAIWDEHITKSNMPEHPTKSKVASSQKSNGSLPKGNSLNSNTENTSKNTHHSANDSGQTQSVFTVYQQEIGPLTSHLADELQEAEQVHGANWVCEALKIASANGKRNWAYVKGILMRWKAEGYGVDKRPAAQSAPAPALNAGAIEKTKRELDDKWNFTPAPPPSTRPQIKQLVERKSAR